MTSVTAVVLTFNEEHNLQRTLEALTWLPRIVIVDSGSSDSTAEIARSFSNVRFFERPFDTHAQQWNFGLAQIATDWVLTLDADYVVSSELAREIETLQSAPDVAGYTANFEYVVFGGPLRASIYPPRVVLFQTKLGRYVDEGHTQQLRIGGKIEKLRSTILHDDRKPLSRWISSQDRYAKLEAEYLGNAECGMRTEEASKSEIRNQKSEIPQLSLQDKLRKMIFVTPIIMPVYLLLGRGLILDGWRGWYYVFQRTLAEMMLSLRLIERKLKS